MSGRTAKYFFSVLLFFFASLLPGARVEASIVAAQDLPDLVEKVLPAVVNISSTTVDRAVIPYGMEDFFQFWGIPRERKQSSLGSGLIINAEQGWVLTNSHVVSNATEVLVSLIDKKAYSARIIGIDPKLDLALLRLSDEKKKVPSGLKQVRLVDSDKVRIAEPVFAVGNPFSLQHTVTTGIISAKNRTIGIGPFDNFLQTDASINPGNSGGPLFNFKGEVIGINTAIYSRTGQSGGLGFAIPVNEAKAVIEPLARYGRVPRPWLGILAERVTPALAQYYGLGSTKGVLLYNLVNRGPADKAGLQVGDIIIEIDGNSALEPNDVERLINKKRPNESVSIKILRGPRTLDRKVVMTEVPPLEQLPQGTL